MKPPPNNTPIIGTWRNEYLHAYVDGAGLANEPKALPFQTYSRATGQFTGNSPPQANAYAMIQRGAKAAGVTTRVGDHIFRATGVTAYLKNGGTLEKAAQMANHASTRATRLYDRRAEKSITPRGASVDRKMLS
jgi:integrase